MKKILSILLISIVFILMVGHVRAIENEDNEIVRTIEDLNRIRKKFGLDSLSMSSALNRASETHNRYMKQQKVLSSIEEKGQTYYRGRYPWDRAAYEKYQGLYIYEILKKDINNYSEGLVESIENPYIRYHLLSPNYSDIGMNRLGEYTTYMMGGGKSSEKEIIYPYNNQYNIPTSYKHEENNDMFKNLNLSNKTVGFPITYTLYSDKLVDRYNITEMVFKDLNRNKTLKYRTDVKTLNNTIVIIPVDPLRKNTSYEIKIKGYIYFKDGSKKFINKTSSFVTESKRKQKEEVKYLTRIDYLRSILTSLNYEIKGSLEIVFKDVSINSSDYKYVYTAYKEGIINGYGEGIFAPDANIKWQDAYVILIRAYERKKGTIIPRKGIKSELVNSVNDSYAINAVKKAYTIGLFNDMDDVRIDPHRYITENEFKDIIRAFEKILK